MLRIVVSAVFLVAAAFAAWADDAQTCQASAGNDTISACTRAIDSRALRGPAFATLYFYRGLAWQRQGNDAKAIDDYAEAARIDPTNIGAFNNLCSRYGDRGEYETAVVY